MTLNQAAPEVCARDIPLAQAREGSPKKGLSFTHATKHASSLSPSHTVHSIRPLRPSTCTAQVLGQTADRLSWESSSGPSHPGSHSGIQTTINLSSVIITVDSTNASRQFEVSAPCLSICPKILIGLFSCCDTKHNVQVARAMQSLMFPVCLRSRAQFDAITVGVFLANFFFCFARCARA